MVDRVSKRNIDSLHPAIRVEVYDMVDYINREVLLGRSSVRVTSGYRSYEEQARLYAIGRTQPGKKVTNAKAGYSFHCFGIAFDICLVLDGKEVSWDVKGDFDGDKQSDWMEVVGVFKGGGYRWGGDWRTFKDMPHFEKDIDISLAGLRELYARNMFLDGTKYLDIFPDIDINLV